MAWTALMTFTANSVLTAAQLNTYIGTGGNLSHTAPAVVTTAGDTVYATGANTLARLAIGATGSVYSSTGSAVMWRVPQSGYSGSSTTTSAAYTDLAAGANPSVTLTTGTHVLVGISGWVENSTAGARCMMSFAVSGATTIAAADTQAFGFKSVAANDPHIGSFSMLTTVLNAGSNTFTAKYKVTTGTGTFQDRRIWVLPL